MKYFANNSIPLFKRKIVLVSMYLVLVVNKHYLSPDEKWNYAIFCLRSGFLTFRFTLFF